MEIKNIVFDLGNVLIKFDPRDNANAALFTDNEEDRNLLLDEVFNTVEWVQVDRGSITREQALASINKRLPERLHAGADLFVNGWFKDGRIDVIPGMEELIKELKVSGYKTYLLSNAGISFHEYYKDIPALSLMDGLFISADWHLLKPSETIYRTFCTHFSLNPPECFFIDDLHINIEGAINMGMPGFIFKGNIEKLKIALRANGVKI